MLSNTNAKQCQCLPWRSSFYWKSIDSIKQAIWEGGMKKKKKTMKRYYMSAAHQAEDQPHKISLVGHC